MTRPPVDWERIEAEYRAGQLSIAEISRQHGVSRPAIDKRAKKFSWTRNLASAVRGEIEARLVADAVAGSVAGCNTRDAIDAAAARGVEVVRQHRELIGSLHRRSVRLGELLDTVLSADTGSEDFARAMVALGKDNAYGANESLVRSASKLIPLERQAFSLDETQADPGSAVAELMELVNGKGRPGPG